MQEIAALERDHVAVQGDGGASWSELWQRGTRGAHALLRWITPPERIGRASLGPRFGVLLEPGSDWIASVLSVWRAGGTAVPLSPLYPEPERERLLADAAAVALIAETPSSRVPTVTPAELGAAEAGGDLPPRDPAAVAFMLFTSGTTGRPKGVCITDQNLVHQAGLLADAWGLDRETRLLHILPLHHMHGIAIALFPVLLAGGAVEFLPRFDAARVWDAFARVSTWMAVPTMYQRLLSTLDDEADEARAATWRAGARQLRLATSGSAALPVTLASRWEAITGCIPLERYGMTEIGVGSSNPREPSARRRGTVGFPLPTVETKIVDRQGREAAEGELLVAGPSVFAGYFNRPDADGAAFSGRWFRTGDIATRTEEGYLKLLGRASVDILKSGGYKLSALEIEEVFRNHPRVAEIAVVGLDDPAWGQRVCAAVVASDSNLAPDELRNWGKAQMAAYKVPRQFAIVEALPRNALGKVLKPAVARMIEERQTD